MDLHLPKLMMIPKCILCLEIITVAIHVSNLMNKLKCIYSGVDANNNYGNRDGKEKNFGGH